MASMTCFIPFQTQRAWNENIGLPHMNKFYEKGNKSVSVQRVQWKTAYKANVDERII